MSILKKIDSLRERMESLPIGSQEVDMAIEESKRLYQIEKLNRYVHSCSDCAIPSEGAVTLRCPGNGNIFADIMMVGEGPGYDEDVIGVPFTGISGILLRSLGYKLGLDIVRDVWLTNVVKCHPKGNRTPTPGEAQFCGRFIEREMEIIVPKVLVAMGTPAMKYFLPDAESISKTRGTMYEYVTRGRRSSNRIPLIVTWHPAYIIRKTGKDFEEASSQFMDDLKKALDKAFERAFAC